MTIRASSRSACMRALAGRSPAPALTARVAPPATSPLPAECNDTEFAWVMDNAVLPLIEARRPQAIMLQAGADGLLEDPLAKLSLSNNTHRAVVRAVMERARRLVVLGGWRLQPWAVGRCWALIWGTLNNFAIPERLPPAAEAGLRGPALRPRRWTQSARTLVHHVTRPAARWSGS